MGPINEDEMEWTELDRGETRFRRKQLGEATEGDRLGCSLYELPPGRKSWPYHYHAGNEEALYVLSGTGTLRTGGTAHDLRPGDYASFPTGESGAHRVINDADEPLRYLMVSTMEEPDVTIYPDSEKFGVYAGSPPGSGDERSLDGYYEIGANVDYWKGE